MSGLSHLVTVVAAIKACVALQHFAIFAAGGGRRRDLAFAITCGCIAGYDLAAAALYRSTSVAEAAEFQHLQVAALVAGSAAFLWFTAEYTRQIPRRLAWLAGGMLTATALVALFDRSGLVFDASRAAVKRVTLPFGPELIYVEAAAGPLVVVQSVIGIGVLAGAVAAAVRQFRGGERREAGPLLFALAVLSLAVVSDGAVATGLYTFPYTLEFAYLSLVVVMALTLVRQLAQAAALEARLRENEARLRHAERLESLGTLAGGVAHDFNNLLAPIMGHAELALDQLDRDHPARADLVGILRAGESAARLTRQLLQVAAGPGSGSGPTDLETLLRDFRPVLRGLLGHRIRLETEVEPGLPRSPSIRGTPSRSCSTSRSTPGTPCPREAPSGSPCDAGPRAGCASPRGTRGAAWTSRWRSGPSTPSSPPATGAVAPGSGSPRFTASWSRPVARSTSRVGRARGRASRSPSPRPLPRRPHPGIRSRPARNPGGRRSQPVAPFSPWKTIPPFAPCSGGRSTAPGTG